MPAPGAWKPDRRPMLVFEAAGANFGTDTQGLGGVWKATPTVSVDYIRRFAAGVTPRFMLWMPMGWLEAHDYYCVTCSDVLQTNILALFQVGGPFAPLPGEQWTLYVGGGMPLSAGVAVETLSSQASGVFATKVKATGSNAAFVADCVRFFGSKGFSQLAIDAFDQSGDDAALEAFATTLKARGQFRNADGTHTVMSEPIPLTYGGGGVTDNIINESLLYRRPWYMLYNDFVATRDPNKLWRVDPARTEVHIKMDAVTLDPMSESAGRSFLNDFVRRGFIIDWGGGPAWAEHWWRAQYASRTARLPTWARRQAKGAA
jgi:hypothetical protein